jgi:methylmalonyl-CoA mutase cobalamin-binding domain/chain
MTRSRIALATVQTDIHDIGKTAVGAMLTATGFEVIDLGVDVPLKTIVDKALEIDAQMIAVSALLTTSLPYMRDLIDLIVQRGLRDRFRVLVGGAPVTPPYAAMIGADGTAPNAIQAALLARRLMEPNPSP